MSQENRNKRKGMGRHWVLWAVILAVALPAGVPAQGGSSAGFILQSGGFTGAGGAARSAGFAQRGAITSRYPASSMSGRYRLLGSPWQRFPEACLVDFAAFTLFAEYWLEVGPGLPADLDSDSDVDAGDLARLAEFWLAACPAQWHLH